MLSHLIENFNGYLYECVDRIQKSNLWHGFALGVKFFFETKRIRVLFETNVGLMCVTFDYHTDIVVSVLPNGEQELFHPSNINNRNLRSPRGLLSVHCK